MESLKADDRPDLPEASTSTKVSSPYEVDDLIQVFLEKNEDLMLDWRGFRLESLGSPGGFDITTNQRIYNWFEQNPAALLKFRREVLQFRGVAITQAYTFTDEACIQAIYGGRIDLDAKVLSETSDDDPLSPRMHAGFEALYLITYDCYVKEFKHASGDVIATLNKRANVTRLRRWGRAHDRVGLIVIKKELFGISIRYYKQ